jgi:hypothetical protein
MKRLGWVALFALVLPTYAMAQQGYTIQTPGQFPTNVNPNGVGGYTAQTPGQLPTLRSTEWTRSAVRRVQLSITT